MWPSFNSLLYVAGGIYGIILIATTALLFLKSKLSEKMYEEQCQRIKTWWVIILLFTFFLWWGKIPALCFIGFISFLALKEYLSLIPTRKVDRKVLLWFYLAIPIQYFWVGIKWYEMFLIFIPVYLFLFLPTCMVLQGEIKGFLKAVGSLQWGTMITIFSVSHMGFILMLPENTTTSIGGYGWFIYLLFLTEINDISQYIWGKSIGKHKITPKVSPNKTVEGFLGGVFNTTVLSVLLTPLLTPMSLPMSIFAGLIIGICGFFGDVTISAFKRDLGVKDSSSMLPGHGGILDRIDSMIFTAPLIFHFIVYFYY